MATAGRKPTPHLQVAREGKVSHRPRKEPLVLPPSTPVEPRWTAQEGLGLDKECARDASKLWRQIAPVLAMAAGLTSEQQATLEEYCIVVARIRQGERVISRDGMVIEGLHGTLVRHPMMSNLNQYRAQFRSLVGELGLSPSSATRIPRREGTAGDDPFDE